MDYLEQVFRSSCLILLTGLLPWLAVAWVMQMISNSIRRGLGGAFGQEGFVYLTVPGVMIHELGHAAFCILFRHKIIDMKLFSPEEDGTLGYVSHQYNSGSRYQRIGNFFIGTGPVWGGLLAIYVLTRLLLPAEMQPFGENLAENFGAFMENFFSWQQWTSWRFYLWLYLILTIAAHITLSSPDIQGAVDGFLMLCASVFLCCLLFGWCGDWEDRLAQCLLDFFMGQFTVVCMAALMLIFLAVLLKMLPGGHRG